MAVAVGGTSVAVALGDTVGARLVVVVAVGVTSPGVVDVGDAVAVRVAVRVTVGVNVGIVVCVGVWVGSATDSGG